MVTGTERGTEQLVAQSASVRSIYFCPSHSSPPVTSEHGLRHTANNGAEMRTKNQDNLVTVESGCMAAQWS